MRVPVDVAVAAAFDDRVDHSSAPAGLFGSDEQPVLLPDGSRADGILAEVMVNLDFAVVDEHTQLLLGFKAAASLLDQLGQEVLVFLPHQVVFRVDAPLVAKADENVEKRLG